MSIRPRPGLVAAIAAMAFATSGNSARADIIDISGGTGQPGAFSGTIEVKHTPGSSTAQIIVTLTNESPEANGGFITGFAFNDPSSANGGDINKVTGFTQVYDPEGAPPANYMSLLGVNSSNNRLFGNSISGSPYGNFDLGAAVGGDLLGGGAPQPGVEVNQTGTFTFTVTGWNLQNLSAESILGTPSSGGTASFMVRFRGFNDNDSDKLVIGTKTPPGGGGGAVPAPPGVVLAGLGIASCLFGRVFRRKAIAVA